MSDTSETQPVLGNAIAQILVSAYGWLPLEVRYGAADAAIKVASEWVHSNTDRGGDDDRS